MVRPSGVHPAAAELTILAVQGPGTRSSGLDFKPILARIARPLSQNRGSNGAPTRTAIVDHGKQPWCLSRHVCDCAYHDCRMRE